MADPSVPKTFLRFWDYLPSEEARVHCPNICVVACPHSQSVQQRRPVPHGLRQYSRAILTLGYDANRSRSTAISRILRDRGGKFVCWYRCATPYITHHLPARPHAALASALVLVKLQRQQSLHLPPRPSLTSQTSGIQNLPYGQCGVLRLVRLDLRVERRSWHPHDLHAVTGARMPRTVSPRSETDPVGGDPREAMRVP